MQQSNDIADAPRDEGLSDVQKINSLIAELGNGLLHASQINMILCGGLKSLQAALVQQVAAILQSFDALRRDVAQIGDHQAKDQHDRIVRFMSDLLRPPSEGAHQRHGQLLPQSMAIQAIIRKETVESERRQTFQTLISALNETSDQLNDLIGLHRGEQVAALDGLPAERIALCEIIKDHMLNHARWSEAAMAQYVALLAVVDRLSNGIEGLFIRLDMLLREMTDVAPDFQVSDCEPLELESIADSALALSVSIEQFQTIGRENSAELNEGLASLIRSLSLDAERSRCQYQELQARIASLGLCVPTSVVRATSPAQ